MIAQLPDRWTVVERSEHHYGPGARAAAHADDCCAGAVEPVHLRCVEAAECVRHRRLDEHDDETGGLKDRSSHTTDAPVCGSARRCTTDIPANRS